MFVARGGLISTEQLFRSALDCNSVINQFKPFLLTISTIEIGKISCLDMKTTIQIFDGRANLLLCSVPCD